MKILHVADIHIALHKKKIPYEWQYHRFQTLFDRLVDLEQETDVTVLAGDIFDKKPEPDEICLFLSYVNRLKNVTLAIPGNHEASSKGKTFLKHFTEDNAISNENFILHTENTRVEVQGQGFQLFPYGEMQTNQVPRYVEGDILVAHIRGEVPPHITAEFDFERLRQWKLCLLGDLHKNHKYKDFPFYYSGSPLNTTFDRNENNSYGVNIIDFNSIDDYSVKFVDLKLPKLIRKTISAGEEMLSDDFNHVMYEVTGSLDNLSKIKNHELLDKKIAEKPSETSKLDLRNKNTREELELWLEYQKIDASDAVLEAFDRLGIEL